MKLRIARKIHKLWCTQIGVMILYPSGQRLVTAQSLRKMKKRMKRFFYSQGTRYSE